MKAGADILPPKSGLHDIAQLGANSVDHLQSQHVIGIIGGDNRSADDIRNRAERGQIRWDYVEIPRIHSQLEI